MYESTPPTTISEASDGEYETVAQDFVSSNIKNEKVQRIKDYSVCMNGAKRLSAFINCTKDEYSSDDNCLFGK